MRKVLTDIANKDAPEEVSYRSTSHSRNGQKKNMDKELPHSIDSEKIVLGSIMTDINALSEVSVILKPDMFYLTTHRGIYDAMLNLTRKGKGTGHGDADRPIPWRYEDGSRHHRPIRLLLSTTTNTR